MAEENKVPGGNDPDAGGDKGGGAGDGDKGDKSGDKKEAVAYETYQKVLDEKKSIQKKHSELESRLKKIEDEKAEAEKKKLEETGSYKELLEKERTEKKELEERLSSITGTLTKAQKRAAVLKHIPGQVEEKYQFLIDADKVVVDEETGEVDPDTAKLVAEKFAKEHPLLIKKKDTKLPPNDAAKHGTAKITPSQWRKLGDSKKMKEQYANVDWEAE